MSAIVQVKNLAKTYAGATTAAVAGLSFEVQAGEVFSLLGPNGAGKTTTLSILSCLLAPTGGEAWIAGHALHSESLTIKGLIGVVPQDIALYPTLTARENLLFWGRMYGLWGAELRRRADEMLEVVGLSDRARERIETYSGGMKRRINIAVGLLHRPQVLFLDEPTVGIDPQSRRNILDMVKTLNAGGMTVLYTTHYMEEAQELSHRVGIIDHGKLIALGTLPELIRLVGGTDVVTLQTAEENVAPDLLAVLGAVDGVQQATAEGGIVRLLCPDGNVVLPELISVANARSVRITNVAIQEPNLEAVFLHLTGRALRD